MDDQDRDGHRERGGDECGVDPRECTVEHHPEHESDDCESNHGQRGRARRQRAWHCGRHVLGERCDRAHDLLLDALEDRQHEEHQPPHDHERGEVAGAEDPTHRRLKRPRQDRGDPGAAERWRRRLVAGRAHVTDARPPEALRRRAGLHVRASQRSQVNSFTRASPLSRRPGVSTAARMPEAMESGSRGSKSAAASPHTSLSDPASEAATGQPDAIASSGGSPKPS